MAKNSKITREGLLDLVMHLVQQLELLLKNEEGVQDPNQTLKQIETLKRKGSHHGIIYKKR